jgi:hypothetical protein
MAAGPEVPQPGTIQYNTYTPVKGGDLGGSRLFGGAGQIWAGIGDTALKAARQFQDTAQMIQQSPLNPAVRSQMYEAQSRANLGRDYIDFVRKNPSYFRGTVGEGPGGATLTAPITQPVAQQEAEGIDYSGGKTEKKEEKEEKKPQQKEEEEKKAPLPSKDLNSGLSQVQPDSINAALASTLVPSQGGSTAASTAGDGGMPNTGQPQDPDVVATPAQPVAPQPSSIWSPGRPAPLAPPAPGAPPPAQQPPPQGQSPAAATMADKASMAQWQAQNAHPVMSSQDALSWMKNQTTLAQDATYLPMGGPGGAPAFAFHMKGGGMNTVPVSQMVSKGAGPLVAAQNTSQVISSTDAAQQQQQQQAAQNQPNISPPPPANLPPGPPAAPTGPQVAQAQPQYPNISPPAPPPAPGAYDPTPYRQGIAQAIATNPQGLMAQEHPQAGVRSTEGTGTGAQPVATSAADVAAMNEESKSPTLLPYWKADAAGNRYKELPDPQHPFWQQRFYPLTGGFQTGAWGDAENMRKQALFEEYAGTGGVPTGVDAKGNKIILDKDTIDRLTPAEQEAWIEHARDYKLHTNALLPSSPDGINLANNANAVQAAQRILDKLQWMKDKGIPISVISQDEIIRSQEAGYSAAANNPIEKGLWNAVSGGFPGGEAQPQNGFVDALNGDYVNLNNYLTQVKGGTYEHAAGTPKAEVWGIPATDWTPPGGIPKSTNVSKGITALNRIGSGDTIDQAIAHAKEVLDNTKKDYKNAADSIPTANTRLPEVDRKNMVDLEHRGYIGDSSNLMRDSQGKLANPYGPIPYKPNPWLAHWEMLGNDGKPIQSTTASATSSASPSPTPMVRVQTPQDVEDFKKKYGKGVPFMGRDRNGNWVQMAF